MRFPLFGLALIAVACAGPRTPAPTSPVPAAQPPTPQALAAGAPSSPVLPPVPLVIGPLVLKVVYPTSNALIQSRDSNFIFGSTGNGNSLLTINGTAVHVWPNGAYLAFLPLPTADSPRYDLVASVGGDTARLSHPIRLQPPQPTSSDSVHVDSLVADSLRIARARADSMHADSVRNGSRRGGKPAMTTAAHDTVIPRLTARDSALTYVALASLPDSVTPDTDRVVIGRPVPAGTYKWFLLPGTVLRQTGRDGEFVRVRLDDALDIWVAAADAVALPAGAPPPSRVVGNLRVAAGDEYTDLVLPMGGRPAYAVEESGRDVILTLYGTRATTDVVAYRPNDPLVRTVEWMQESADRARYTVHLRERPFGYLVLWQNGTLVLRLRHRPQVDPQRPLRGLTIAVDPGHPPIGATGPTGLWEAQATLWVGERRAALLRERGATVLMTRTTMEPVALGDRPTIARRGNAQLLVSIHLNALPDGINPFKVQGTGTYFFQPHAEGLARAVQRGLVARMALPDLGVFYDNLALTRPTWMPAILCEGAFMMMPDQEAALRTPQFEDAYARGIADGIEEYLRGLPADR